MKPAEPVAVNLTVLETSLVVHFSALWLVGCGSQTPMVLRALWRRPPKGWIDLRTRRRRAAILQSATPDADSALTGARCSRRWLAGEAQDLTQETGKRVAVPAGA